jgi:hypothetical protein
VRRLIAFLLVSALSSSALATGVSSHQNPNGSVTITVIPAGGESVRSFHVWLPPGSHPSGTTSLPVDPASGDVLSGWSSSVENGPRGSGWGWVNPGTNGHPLGPDGMSVTITPGLLSGTSGAFSPIWSTDSDGHPSYPPHGGTSWPANAISHGPLVGPDGEPVPLPIRGVSLGFSTHGSTVGCSCAPGEPLGGIVQSFGVGDEDPVRYQIFVRVAVAPLSKEAWTPANGSGRRRLWPSSRDLFGLDRVARVPDDWQLLVEGSSGSGIGPNPVTFSVSVGSAGRGQAFYAVVVADFDGDGAPDAWSEPALIEIR